MMRLLLSALLAVLVTSFQTASAAIIDQSIAPPHNASFNGVGFDWQRQVIAGISGQLVGIDVYIAPVSATFSFQLNLGSPWQTDADDFATTFTASGMHYVNLSAASIFLTAGDSFTFSLSGNSSLRGTYNGAQPGGVYTAGSLYLNGSVYSDNRFDLGFRTYVEPAAVPEPTSIALLGLGGIGLVATRKRRQAV